MIATEDSFNPRQAVIAVRTGAAARTKIDGDTTCGIGVAGPIRAIAACNRVIASTANQRVIVSTAVHQVIANATRKAV